MIKPNLRLPDVLHRCLSVLLVSSFAFGFSSVFPAYSQSAGSGWSFTPVAAVGQNGFTRLDDAYVGDNGLVAVYGVRNSQEGIFAIRNSDVITVATVGTVLSGTLGTIDRIDSTQIGIDPDNRVVFTANVTGSSLPPPANASRLPAFRWSDGTISHMQPSASNVSHFPRFMNSQGQWLADAFTGTSSNGTRSFQITDGAAVTNTLSVAESSANCRSVRAFAQAAPNANGALPYYTRINQRRSFPGGCDPEEFTEDWTLALGGTISSTIASGQLTDFALDNNTNGTNIRVGSNSYHLNDNGDVVYIRDQYTNALNSNAPTNRQLILRDGSGEVVLLQGNLELFVYGFDNAKRVALDIRTGANPGIYAGPNVQTDRVISPGDTLFGATSTGVILHDVSAPPATFGDKRVFVFTYFLQDGTQGIALASKGVTRWANAAGGAWTTAANWSPAEVPGSTTETLFDLEASYDVSVGPRQTGRSSIQNGSVSFRNAQLELLGPLAVGGDADLVIPEGSLTAGEITVGSLPPINPAQPPLARLAVSNAGTVLNTGGLLRVGNAGDGQLDLNGGAQATNAEARLGDGASGTANVRNAGTLWTTGNIAVGEAYTGTLRVESGGRVESGRAIVGGSARPDPAITSRATVNGGSPAGTASAWNIAQNLNIGVEQNGEVLIENGGALRTTDLVIGIGQEVDGALVVQGAEGSRRSTLTVVHDAFVGFAGRGFSVFQVRDGAQAFIEGDLVLGELREAEGTVTVGGRDASGNPATLKVLSLNGTCVIAREGRGSLFINPDAIVECTEMLIGGAASGRGEIIVHATPGHPALLDVDSLQVGAIGSGVLNLRDGTVRSQIGTHIGSNGRLEGSGTIEGPLTSAEGSEFDPGLAPTIPSGVQQAALAPADVFVPGTITINGGLTISPTASITLDLIGANDYDRVVVNGSANLGGNLALNFLNGYAPKQGDTFTFVQSASTSGQFANVTVTGLAPGFQFDVTTVNGVTQLVAKNDGVATTQPMFRVYLPVVRR